MARRWVNWNARARDAWVAEHARSLAKGSRVLDIGAGGCPYRACFAHCAYITQDATPLSDRQLSEGGYGAIDHRCDATSIPEPSASFNAILCTEVLEHVIDPAAVMKEAARLLRPGGVLLVTAPLGSGLHQQPVHYYGGFTPHWYERVLGDNGFEAISITANGGSFRHFAQWCVQVLLLARPRALGRGALGVLIAIVLLPLLALLLLPAALLALLIDPLDRERAFTVGYHVRATRRGDQREGARGPDARERVA